MYSLLPVDVWVESVTGERWAERVRLFETVAELKRRIWRRKRIVPSKQAIVYAGRSLLDNQELDSIGVRGGSILKLLVIARAGPLASREQEEAQMLSDEPSDREHGLRARRGCSAAEDTSAKESSAGETEREHDDEIGRERLARLAEASSTSRHLRRMRTNSQSTNRDFSLLPEMCNLEGSSGNVDLVCREADLSIAIPIDKNLRVDSPLEEIPSEDPSELSSGMIICNLSNEFRKLKVRRHRHPTLPSASRQRARSKPRVDHEGTSSDDNDTAPTHLVVSSLPVRRGVSTRSVRTIGLRGGAVRCSVCAFRISSAFNCRCGKTLCSRHRSAQSHTCSKIRAKLQQVSD